MTGLLRLPVGGTALFLFVHLSIQTKGYSDWKATAGF